MDLKTGTRIKNGRIDKEGIFVLLQGYCIFNNWTYPAASGPIMSECYVDENNTDIPIMIVVMLPHSAVQYVCGLLFLSDLNLQAWTIPSQLYFSRQTMEISSNTFPRSNQLTRLSSLSLLISLPLANGVPSLHNSCCYLHLFIIHLISSLPLFTLHNRFRPSFLPQFPDHRFLLPSMFCL
jgi:hypothetical protein